MRRIVGAQGIEIPQNSLTNGTKASEIDLLSNDSTADIRVPVYSQPSTRLLASDVPLSSQYNTRLLATELSNPMKSL